MLTSSIKKASPDLLKVPTSNEEDKETMTSRARGMVDKEDKSIPFIMSDSTPNLRAANEKKEELSQ